MYSAQICHSLEMRGQSPRRKKMKVFIADDSPLFVERLTELLRDVPGVKLAGQAGDVSESVRRIRQMKPDAVILDLQMPGALVSMFSVRFVQTIPASTF